jgi:ribosome-binding protein aMBF1 (putative translation factor)
MKSIHIEQRVQRVGLAIREARRRAKLSQEALAEKCELLRVLAALGIDRLTV